MKIINAQVEVLKEAYKNKSHLVYGSMGDVMVYGDAHRIYITPKVLVGIDLHNFDNVKFLSEDTLKGLTNDREYEEATVTNEIVIADNGKGKLRVFKVNDEKVYVNEKLLKNFDLESDFVTFRGKKYNAPIFIYENNAMVGLVCPVVFKGGN